MMAVRVVYVLEAVYVEHYQRERGLVPHRPFEFFLEPRVEKVVVVSGGEMVFYRDLAQTVFFPAYLFEEPGVFEGVIRRVGYYPAEVYLFPGKAPMFLFPRPQE